MEELISHNFLSKRELCITTKSFRKRSSGKKHLSNASTPALFQCKWRSSKTVCKLPCTKKTKQNKNRGYLMDICLQYLNFFCSLWWLWTWTSLYIIFGLGYLGWQVRLKLTHLSRIYHCINSLLTNFSWSPHFFLSRVILFSLTNPLVLLPFGWSAFPSHLFGTIINTYYSPNAERPPPPLFSYSFGRLSSSWELFCLSYCYCFSGLLFSIWISSINLLD